MLCSRRIRYRNFSNFYGQVFPSNLSDFNWLVLLEDDSTDNKINILNKALMNWYDKYAALQKFYVKNLSVSLLSKDIKNYMW